jgi:hypothetical protein
MLKFYVKSVLFSCITVSLLKLNFHLFVGWLTIYLKVSVTMLESHLTSDLTLTKSKCPFVNFW